MKNWPSAPERGDPESGFEHRLRGEAAAARGRAALEAALGGSDAVERAIHRDGRPSIDPAAAPGPQPGRFDSPPMSSQLDQLAAAQHRRPSDLLRDAVAAYLDTHKVAR